MTADLEDRLVARIEAEVRAAADADAALLATVRTICLACQLPYGEVWTRYSERPNLRMQAFWHLPKLELAEFVTASRRYAFASGVGMPGRILQSRRSEIIEDIRGHHGFSRQAMAVAAGFRAAAGFPVTRGDDPVAVLIFFMFKPERALLELIAQLAGTIDREIAKRWPDGAKRTAVRPNLIWSGLRGPIPRASPT